MSAPAVLERLGAIMARHRYVLEAEPGSGGEPMLVGVRRIGATALTPAGSVTVHEPRNDLARGLEELLARLVRLEQDGKL